MTILAKVVLAITDDEITLRTLTAFVEQARQIGADEDQDLRVYDENPAVVALEAVGTLSADDGHP